ncbi:RIP homotypic interaction motif-containing protein [Burkholderia sp. CCA53]|uniref:RIP homotypic interaction motif-containing protein n=1 Tax=Burkholderia sp. CCA53 TaxID=1776288 RepID=UPI00080BB833|nr:RIP homotypic interaction motif-containing protein [Burkholderia sp. CCA53]
MNNPFASMHTDTVRVESPDGTQSGTYMTKIGAKNGYHAATVFDESFIGAEGWILSRELPNGREDTYKIVEANYSKGISGIPPHWSLKLYKDASLLHVAQGKPAPSITINHSHGIQIGDHNVQHIASSLAGLIEKIDGSAASAQEKEEAKNLVGKLLESPVVASVLGGTVSGVLALLKHS